MNDLPSVSMLRILHLEDNLFDGALVKRTLERSGFMCEFVRVEGRPEFERALAAQWDAILADFALPDFDGMSALAMAAERCPAVPFVFVSGAIGEETAVEALKRGATDYVLKDNLGRLAPAVRRAVEESFQRRRRVAAEEALRQSEETLRATFEQAAVGIVHIGHDGHFLRANRKFCEMLGYTEDEICQRRFVDVAYPPDREIGLLEFEQSASGQISTFTVEKRYARSDGSIIWVRITSSVVRNTETAEPQYNVAIIEDITQRKGAERRLREAQAKLGLAIAVAMLGFWEWEPRTNAVYFSPEWKKQLGYEDSELSDRYEEWVHRLHPEDREQVVSRQSQYFREHDVGVDRPELELEFRLRHKDGSYRWIAARITCVRSENGTSRRLMGTHLDITSRKEAEERIRQVSQHDPLTGLPNRALLYEFGDHLLSRAARSGTRTAFLFFDLDRFKPINDTYGHDVGDAVLREVGRRLTECVRGEDLVGRLGGDEFLAVLAHVRTENDAAKAALHALESLGRPYITNGLELSVSPSIGISLYPSDGKTVDQLIRSADVAMYHAKESGRNSFQFFKQDLNERASQALRIENALRKGLEREEFVLFYQPVIDTETEAVVGAEALLRWPGMGAGPAQFIPVAETAGFMPTLGDWVVKEACWQQRLWQDKGLPTFPVAVNVSPTQFRQKDFARNFCDALVRASVDPSSMHIEVTESTVMKNIQEASGVLHALQEMGVQVALDDFGTGYSSLSNLSELPINILKLDQSFVQKIGRDRSSIAITEGIIALGHSLGLEVIAEGIESEEALSFLRAHQCRRGQGFHFCRPMPADDFEQWYRSRAS